MLEILIDDLSHDGRGVGRFEGKTIFVADTVPGDQVLVKVIQQHRNFDEAILIELLSPSAERMTPVCDLFKTCGGCQLQHVSIAAQRAWKQSHFLTAMEKSLEMKGCEIVTPLVGKDLGYRRRAKFSVGRPKSDKQAKVGFRQKASQELVDVETCPVLVPELNEALAKHRAAWLQQASRAYKEFTVVKADEGVFGFEARADQPSYSLNGLKMAFDAEGFVQVNEVMNQKMVAQAIDWLALQPNHRVLDLFCGIGNFTLPIAVQVQEVVGIEGVQELVVQAEQNAQANALSNTAFYKADLFDEACQKSVWFAQQRYDRVLLDPGRLGAHAISSVLSKLQPELIVYVSCNAATLIRDVKVLQAQGYRLTKAGMMDMFPHTTHTEVMVQLKKHHKPVGQKKVRKVFRF